MRILLLCFISVLSLHSRADLESTITYLKGLIAENKKVAVLLVGMQDGFYKDYGALTSKQIDDIISDQITLVDRLAGEEKLLFITITQDNYGNPLEILRASIARTYRFKLFTKSEFSGFSPLHEVVNIHSGDSNEDVSYKDYFNKNLADYLRKNDIDNVFITGCYDSYCLYATAKDALKEGFSVATDRDLNIIADRSDMQKGESEVHASIDEATHMWEKLKKDNPKLKVIAPTRYQGCTP